MRTCTLFALAIVSLLLEGCVEQTLLFCQNDSACNVYGPRSHCDLVAHACISEALLAPDLSPANSDGGAADLSAEPDLLAPSRCTQTSDCTDTQAPVCGSGGQCETCDSELDDAICLLRDATSPRCRISGAGAGHCVACREAAPNQQSGDCQAVTQPICAEDGSCRGCRMHAECTSGLCDLGEGGQKGRCVPASEVVFVDNRDVAVATCKTLFNTMQTGNEAEPYCDIDQAVDAVPARPVLWIKVTGRSAVYSPLGLASVTHGMVVVHGPGSTTGPTVTIAGAATLVSVESASLKLLLEGLVVGKPSAGQACILSTLAQSITLKDVMVEGCFGVGVQIGVAASAGGALTAERLLVRNVEGVGVIVNTADARLSDSKVTGCDKEGLQLFGNAPVLDRIFVENNAGGGIELGPLSEALIQNSIILGNGNNSLPMGPVTLFGGIWAKGTLRIVNSTIDSNEANDASPAGLRCESANGVAFNSVFFGNVGLLDAPMSATCTVHASAFVFDGAASNNNVTLKDCASSDIFVSDSVNLRPRKDAKDGCRLIDLGQASTTGISAPTVDIEGSVRPQGVGYEIGAYEVTP